LDALIVGITSTKVNFILDADIRSFFNEVSQDWLVRFVKHRIDDPRIIRLIQKWLPSYSISGPNAGDGARPRAT
jgi:RNA-directed DNA polymerase